MLLVNIHSLRKKIIASIACSNPDEVATFYTKRMLHYSEKCIKSLQLIELTYKKLNK